MREIGINTGVTALVDGSFTRPQPDSAVDFGHLYLP